MALPKMHLCLCQVGAFIHRINDHVSTPHKCIMNFIDTGDFEKECLLATPIITIRHLTLPIGKFDEANYSSVSIINFQGVSNQKIVHLMQSDLFKTSPPVKRLFYNNNQR